MSTILIFRDTDKGEARRQEINVGKPDRGRGRKRWTLRTNFLLTDLLKPIEDGNGLIKYMGFVGGYRVALALPRSRKGKMKMLVTLGAIALTNHGLPPPVWTLQLNVGFKLQSEVDTLPQRFRKCLTTFLGDSRLTVGMKLFDEPWGQVVRENSPFFPPNGNIAATVTFEKLSKID